MSIFRRTALAISLAAPLALGAAPAFAQSDIVDTATADKNLSTLVTAVKAADLVTTLKGKGPFTVFAPTDEAFKKLPAGTLENLLKPENKKQLASILNYHVLPGTYDAARITKPKVKKFGIKSAQGSNVNVDLTKGVVVSGATVTKSDIKASNGIIHVVDTVMIPRSVKIAMAAQALKDKAKAVGTKALDATKAAAGKAVEATKGAATKAGDAIKGAAEKAKEAVTPAPSTTSPAAPAPKKP
jgi:uncharacterized surface protein with fasciclin (FAS1) repeats